jgi:hypothetical protein
MIKGSALLMVSDMIKSLMGMEGEFLLSGLGYHTHHLLTLIYPFLGFPKSNLIRLYLRVADLMRFTL